jgi:hypothetical protein
MTIAAPPTVIAPDGAHSLLQPAAATQSQAAQNQVGQNQAPPSQPPASLAEYLATMNPNTLASGASPSQLGQDMITGLRGFFDRSHSMTGRARALADPTPPPHAAMTVAHRGPAQAALDPSAVRVGPQPAPGSVDGQQMNRVIQALGMMFDYSIETQLVVRGSTQVSGAANTLLRGQ